ncbi:MAG: hypothetical protein LBR69_06195, partial [Endomicrobium sp.]|nr:hypothetical protein [Endomicrobium sp.]
MSKINWKLCITAALLFFSVWALWPSFEWAGMPQERREKAEREKEPILGRILKLGLDLKGGT